MTNSLYENGWLNSEHGYYYRDKWYADEAALNKVGFYLVHDVYLYLGLQLKLCRYHDVYYEFDSNDYRKYEDVHSLGYSKYICSLFSYVADSYSCQSFYNKEEGYFIRGTWYSTLDEMHSAGFYLYEEKTPAVPEIPNYFISGGYIDDESSTENRTDFQYSVSVGNYLIYNSTKLTEYTPTLSGAVFLHDPVVYPHYEYTYPAYNGTDPSGQQFIGTVRLSNNRANHSVSAIDISSVAIGDYLQDEGRLTQYAYCYGGYVLKDE